MNRYYFIDESGDTEFFGKRAKKLWENEGWHPILIMGLIETSDRKQLRKDVEQIHQMILDDPLYQDICSLSTTDHFFHARGDHPEVRAAFFQFLKGRSDFKCYLSIERKNPDQFISKFNKSSTAFYFHAVRQLLDLPKFDQEDKHHFYLSKRNKTTNEHFNRVLQEILCKEMQDDHLTYQAEIVKSSEYPELCVIDYMLWAIQRYILKGEKRFLQAMSDKITIIRDQEEIESQGQYKLYSTAEFLSSKWLKI